MNNSIPNHINMTWEQFVAAVAEGAEIPEGEITRDTRLGADLLLDSIVMMQVIVTVQVELGVDELPAELQTDDWWTLSAGDLFELVRNHQARRWQLRQA